MDEDLLGSTRSDGFGRPGDDPARAPDPLLGETRIGARRPFDPDAPAPGQSLHGGRYVLEARLGSGGMGEVWRARDTRLELSVAIKIVPPRLAGGTRSRKQLAAEAKAAMQLSHDHIVRVHTLLDEGDTPFLVMDYVPGRSLQDILEAEGPLPEAEAVRLLAQVCDGLAYAHAHRVIHRDIKPGNILIDAAGRPRIVDFGIARVLQETHTRLTGEQTTGTLLYMSPEQLRGRACDGRSDLYSLGCTAFELLSGDPPFVTGDITHQHLAEPPPPLPGVSERLARWVAQCLAKDPAARFPDAAAAKAALLGEAQAAAAAPQSRAAPGAPSSQGQPPRRRVVPLLAVGVVAVCLLGGVLGWRWVRAREAARLASRPASVAGHDHRTASAPAEPVQVPARSNVTVVELAQAKLGAEQAKAAATEGKVAEETPGLWRAAERAWALAVEVDGRGGGAGHQQTPRPPVALGDQHHLHALAPLGLPDASARFLPARSSRR